MIHRIESLADERVSPYAHIADPAWLLDRGLFVAEGRLVVQRLLENPGFTVHSVLVTPAAAAALGSASVARGVPVYVCEQHVMNALAGFNFHRGCLAIAARPETPPPIERFSGAYRLLALQGVGNPDNVGGLFRAAAALGASGVLLDQRSGDPLYRKAIRTSMGASLRLPFVRLDRWLDDLRGLQRGGMELVALTPASSATALSAYARTVPPDRRLVLMLGSEGEGLTGEALAIADARVRIPVSADVDSLNVVVAAGIALATLPSASTDRSRDPHRP